jgi:hypothetical protein
VVEVAESAILPFLYDFYFEREVEWGVPTEKDAIKVGSGKEETAQPSPKNLELRAERQAQQVCRLRCTSLGLKMMRSSI